MRDIYDEAVDYLKTQSQATIREAWNYATADPRPGSILFRRAGHRFDCGCLTMVKSGGWDAQNKALTAAIRADDRIPSDGDFVSADNLEIFAEWNRRLDKELNRAVTTSI